MAFIDSLCGQTSPGVWVDGYIQPCFEDVVLFGIFFFYMAFCLIFRFIQLLKISSSKERKFSMVHTIKIVLHWIIIISSLMIVVGRLFLNQYIPYQLVFFTGMMLLYFFSFIIVEMEFARQHLHNWTLLSSWTLNFVFSSIRLQTMVAELENSINIENELALFSLGFAAVLVLALLGLFSNSLPGAAVDEYRKFSEEERLQESHQSLLSNSEKHKSYSAEASGSIQILNGKSKIERFAEEERRRSPSPEDSASWISQLLYIWMNPILNLGYKRVLEEQDLYNLSMRDTAKINGDSLTSNWKMQQKLNSLDPSLVKALAASYGWDFAFAGCLKLLQDVLTFVGPLCLNLIISFISDPQQPDWHGYTYVAILTLASFSQSLTLQTYFNIVFRIGMRMRSGLTTLIYQKGFRLSPASRMSSTVGDVVNHMAIDSQKICDLMPYLHLIWSSPLQVIICIVALGFLLGWPILSGLTLMIVMIPINGFIMKKLTVLQKQIMVCKDKRVKAINESLQGIRLIKFFAWESSFEKKIGGIRDEELAVLRKAAYLKAVVSFLWASTPLFVSIITFITFGAFGNILTPEIAFTSLSLFNILRFPLNMLPTVITAFVEARVSSVRIKQYLAKGELDPYKIKRGSARDSEFAISIRNAGFSWTDRAILSNINLKVAHGSLAAIVGAVGVGKSSLLSGLLGDMDCHGDIYINGTVAYVSQEAWIQNATVRENILFGSPYDERRYSEVVRLCELDQDLSILPSGDLTEIGEKGINLSGGQKQRVSLARAVYQNCDIYLLDDPLSAVDSHVGKAIFENCIAGYLQGKTRILVTHQLQHLSKVDLVVCIKDGHFSELGTYAELISNKGDFFNLITSHVFQQDEGSSEEEDKSSSSSSSSQKKSSKKEEEKTDEKKDSKLIAAEDRVIGEVRWEVYKLYIAALGGTFVVCLILFLMALERTGSVSADWWLSYWSDNQSDNDKHSTNFYLGIYATIGVVTAMITLMRSLMFAHATITSARKVHHRLLLNILRVPVSFFDSTPVGRIINRFSKDQYNIDETLPRSMSMYLTMLFASVAVVAVIGAVTPFFLTALLPLGYIYNTIQRYYIRSSRELKRLDAVTKSPVFVHFGESLSGSSVIKAFNKVPQFNEENRIIIDNNQRAYFLNNISNRWLGVRLELIGTIIVSLASLFAVVERDNIDPGSAGLSLTYALQTTSLLNWLIRMYTEVESQMVSVERMEEYSVIPQEAQPFLPYRPPAEWPAQGKITFNDYKLRYRPDSDLVIKGITLDINGGERIGVVGRTGAGKSSLMQGIYRLIEPAGGSIIIDAIDISKIGLQDLRDNLSIIPQDPTLFTGTIRTNLDPFDHYNEAQIWNALRAVFLFDEISSLPKKLDAEVSEYGSNLSVGQRQLLCLARALLRRSKIIIMDEATASVDFETDRKIQETIRREFEGCTVLTIAHRINTILDYDRVLVLDGGRIAEYDSPGNLRADPNGVFFSMVEKSGVSQ